jgi:hypothetical protein
VGERFRAPNSCQIFANTGGPLQSVDGSVFMQYDMELGSLAARTVVVHCKAF